MNCPKCGESNSSEELKCSNCGEQINNVKSNEEVSVNFKF